MQQKRKRIISKCHLHTLERKVDQTFRSGALPGKMMLVRIVENNKLYVI